MRRVRTRVKHRVEIIGDAILYLGDCLEVMDYVGPVEHIITDPPYENITQELHNTIVLRRTDGGHGRSLLPFSGIDALREPFIYNVKKINSGWLLAFCSAEGVWFWRDALIAAELKYKLACLWIKPDARPKLNGQSPAVAYECISTTWCGKGRSCWNGGGRRGLFVHPTNGDRFSDHPTEKPIGLMIDLVSLFSKREHTILDPFMGSGTTGVACLRLGRKFIGIEIEPKYFDIACKRIDKEYRRGDLFHKSALKFKRVSLL